jgi:hypothetical protein
LLEIEAKEKNPLLYDPLKNSEELIHKLVEGAKMTVHSKSGVQGPLKNIITTLKAKDKILERKVLQFKHPIFTFIDKRIH